MANIIQSRELPKKTSTTIQNKSNTSTPENNELPSQRDKILQLQSTIGNHAVVQFLKTLNLLNSEITISRNEAAKDKSLSMSNKIHKIAAKGVQGTGNKLPHFDKIQLAFAKYDLSNVQAYTNENAVNASKEIDAKAYTTGNKIAFSTNNPDVFTVAHEVAHVLQQRAGVQLNDGIGVAHDCYEMHANAVATQIAGDKPIKHLLPSSQNGNDRFNVQSTNSMELQPVQKMQLNEFSNKITVAAQNDIDMMGGSGVDKSLNDKKIIAWKNNFIAWLSKEFDEGQRKGAYHSGTTTFLDYDKEFNTIYGPLKKIEGAYSCMWDYVRDEAFDDYVLNFHLRDYIDYLDYLDQHGRSYNKKVKEAALNDIKVSTVYEGEEKENALRVWIEQFNLWMVDEYENMERNGGFNNEKIDENPKGKPIYLRKYKSFEEYIKNPAFDNFIFKSRLSNYIGIKKSRLAPTELHFRAMIPMMNEKIRWGGFVALTGGSQERNKPFYNWLYSKNAGCPNIMNCWEAVLYAACTAGLISKDYIKMAIQRFEASNEMGPPNFVSLILAQHVGKSFDNRNSYTTSTGHVVLFGEGGQHVALATGGKKQIQDQDCEKLYGRSIGSGIFELDKLTDGVIHSTIEDVMSRVTAYSKVITWGTLPSLEAVEERFFSRIYSEFLLPIWETILNLRLEQLQNQGNDSNITDKICDEIKNKDLGFINLRNVITPLLQAMLNRSSRVYSENEKTVISNIKKLFESFNELSKSK
jgi:hypothetical protein